MDFEQETSKRVERSMSFCQCGCGQEIIAKQHHIYYGTPRFIHGHNNSERRFKKGDIPRNKIIIPKIPILCACGCNEAVWNGNRYIIGHSNKGKHASDQTKEKIKQSLSGERNPAKRPDVRAKLSIVKRGRFYPGTGFKKGHKANIGRPCSKETRRRISVSNKGKHAGKVPWNKKDKAIVICLQCSKEFLVHQCRTHKTAYANIVRFCSHSCRAKHVFTGRNGELSGNWKGGVSFEPYCSKFNKRLKERVRERDGRVCQICRRTEKENGKKLAVHHIHYDKENCYPDLIALCAECSTKVNFNREYFEDLFMENLRLRGMIF